MSLAEAMGHTCRAPTGRLWQDQRVHRALLPTLVLLLASSSAVAGSQRLAVLELRGASDPAVRGALTDQVRAGALKALAGLDVLVMTRENMAAIARDMGLDLSCAEEAAECEVDLGRSIGASLVVSGELARFGDSGVVATLKLHDTTSGGLLGAETAQAGTEFELLDRLADRAALLVRSGLGAAPRPRASGSEGRIRGSQSGIDFGGVEYVLQFESQPSGAVVSLDGELLCQSTPCSREVGAGKHLVVVQAERHHRSERAVSVEDHGTVSFTLAPTFGRLSVTTEPPGLPVSIDDRVVGDSPLSAQELDPGLHSVVLASRCHLAEGERVTVEEGGARRVHLVARPRLAGVRVRAADSQGNALRATVRVEGRELGVTPTTLELPLCTAGLEVVAEGLPTKAQVLRLKEGEVAEIRVELGEGLPTSAAMRPARPGPCMMACETKRNDELARCADFESSAATVRCRQSRFPSVGRCGASNGDTRRGELATMRPRKSLFLDARCLGHLPGS